MLLARPCAGRRKNDIRPWVMRTWCLGRPGARRAPYDNCGEAAPEFWNGVTAHRRRHHASTDTPACCMICAATSSEDTCATSASRMRDSAAVVFFGAFLVTALAGMPSIDAKLARRDPNTWQALSAATSIVPFVAIAQGRNRLVPHEIGWRTPAIGAIAWIALLVLHPWLFGVAPAAL